jgi:hypothetical protein
MMYILFSDVLIRARGSWMNKLYLESSTHLELVEVVDSSDPDDIRASANAQQKSFTVFLYGNGTTPPVAHLVTCETPRDRQEWILEIKAAKDELLPREGLVRLDGIDGGFEVIEKSTTPTASTITSAPAPPVSDVSFLHS